MRLHDAPGDGEAESGTLAVAIGSLTAHLGKFVEDASLILRSDANACVRNGNLNLPAMLSNRDGDHAAWRGEFEGVAHKIDQHLLDAFCIEKQARKAGGKR